MPDLALALDQREVNTSGPGPAADAEVEGVGLPRVAAFVEEDCFWPIPGKL